MRHKKEVGALCKCGKGHLFLQELAMKPKKLKKAYYFSHALVCNVCHRFYYEEKFKVLNKDVCEKNIEESIALGMRHGKLD